MHSNGLNGGHYEFLIGAGCHPDAITALAAAVYDVRSIPAPEAPDTEPDIHDMCSPTIPSPRGVVHPPPSSKHIRVAA